MQRRNVGITATLSTAHISVRHQNNFEISIFKYAAAPGGSIICDQYLYQPNAFPIPLSIPEICQHFKKNDEIFQRSLKKKKQLRKKKLWFAIIKEFQKNTWRKLTLDGRFSVSGSGRCSRGISILS